jgi:hypothetical protein
MDLKKYDELRKKINTKDFEGNNKGLDKWLFRFSFIGNASSIFFAYFLVYPALLKAITLNFISGFWGTAIAFLFTLIFLTIFEITKRYLIRNFSSDFNISRRKLNFSTTRWFLISIAVVVLSFYLSITGSRNLASTSVLKNKISETEIVSHGDSLSIAFQKRIDVYENDNETLRLVNTDLRQKLAETPLNYMTARKEYQTSIDKNIEVIKTNQAEIDEINAELNKRLALLDADFNQAKTGNEKEDSRNILLFIIIVVFNELIIIGGVYFREYFEYMLYEINHQKFEKMYQKKDRYRALLTFVYGDGKLTTGDKVIPGLELKTIVAEKTNIPNSNKLVDEFLQDMDRLGIFATTGKRRHVAVTYQEAIDVIDKYDDAFRALENMK